MQYNSLSDRARMGRGTQVSDGPAVSDEVLAKQARHGDREAFAELYRRYEPRVSGYVRRRVRESEQHDVEDLVQEVFAAALETLAEFRDDRPDAWCVWLFGVVARRTVRHHGWERWQQHQAERGAAEELWRDVRQACAPADDGALSEGIATAVAVLPRRQRQILELRYLEGLPLAQAARIMGLSPRSAGANEYAAMRRLRPNGVTRHRQHKRDGTPSVSRDADGWRGYAYITGPDGKRVRKEFHHTTFEAAVARWAELTSAADTGPATAVSVSGQLSAALSGGVS
jgi:RNA polymerase sigma-70 factor (ECF subfamily)